MKKSQLITLIILFVAVSLFIWIGALSDKSDEVPSGNGTVNKKPVATASANNTPAQPSATTEPTQPPVQEVDLTQLEGLNTGKLNIAFSNETMDFMDNETKSALEQCTYLLSNPGQVTNDIYLSFKLHYSDLNTRVEKLLDLAKSKNIKFTFYLSSMYLDDEVNVDIIKRIYSEGHTIGSRGYKNQDQPDTQLAMSAEELKASLESMEKRLQTIVGDSAKMQFYSPDFISQRNAKLASLMGYTVTFKRGEFATDAGSRSETYNGIQFESSNISDNLVTQVTSYVEWAMSQGYTFKGFTK